MNYIKNRTFKDVLTAYMDGKFFNSKLKSNSFYKISKDVEMKFKNETAFRLDANKNLLQKKVEPY